MLPIITEEIAQEVYEEALNNIPQWRKKMVQYLKEETPEVNSAILEVAKHDESIDLKAVALGAYMSYRLLELSTESDDLLMEEG